MASDVAVRGRAKGKPSPRECRSFMFAFKPISWGRRAGKRGRRTGLEKEERGLVHHDKHLFVGGVGQTQNWIRTTDNGWVLQQGYLKGLWDETLD